MKKQCDLLIIGLGPAGMAAAIMGHAMGLHVCAIEKNKVGGECMNVGCIPSKSLLRIAEHYHICNLNTSSDLNSQQQHKPNHCFNKINEYLEYIANKKTKSLLDNIEVIFGEASFINTKEVSVNEHQIVAKKIFLGAGTAPLIPPIKGLNSVNYLTNQNIFKLSKLPESLLILGGGPIGIEMAQAFNRLGVRCSVVHMDEHIIPLGDKESAELLSDRLEQEGVAIFNKQNISEVVESGGQITLTCEDGKQIIADKILIAAGRKPALNKLKLENAKVKLDKRGFIAVNKYLQTNKSNIFAVGDCNGESLFSHAAMHQSMLALMNCLSPIKFNFHNYVVPWTIFTQPQFAAVGLSEKALKDRKLKFEVIKVNYSDYGAAIAEDVSCGFVKVFVNKWGKIYGAVIIGENAGEMINQWGYAIQNKVNMKKIMFLQHSFPTMSFLNKRVAETWMMNRFKSKLVQAICKLIF